MSVPFVLTLITPRAPDLARLRDALAALPPGAAAVQLRQPDGATRRALAQPIATLCRDHGAALLVNDDLPLAAAIGADGAQLPERGPSVAAAREALGEAAWIGVSRHDAPGLRAARDATFALLSPVFTVPGKGAPLGVDGFARAARGAPLPVHALGGVTAASASALRDVGASGVAVIRAVFDAKDAAAAAAALAAPFLA